MKGVHFYMAKLTREQRIEIYHKRKSGVTIEKLKGLTPVEYRNQSLMTV